MLYIFVIFFSGHMDNRSHAIAMFVKSSKASSTDSLMSHTILTRELVHCHLTITSKHMEYWRSAVHKVKTWTFLNKESEPMHFHLHKPAVKLP